MSTVDVVTGVTRHWIRGFARYAWCSPNTLLGLFLAAAAILTGGRAVLRDGNIEVHGGVLRPALRRIARAAAMTLGHVILAGEGSDLDAFRRHEQAHVRQAERWGILFLPAYATASVLARLRGGRWYHDNAFEVQARREEHRPAASLARG